MRSFGHQVRKTITCVLFIMACSSAHAAAPSQPGLIQVMPGTEVRLLLDKELSSETSFKNQLFTLTVDSDVRVRGQVVIPKGTKARGRVVRASGREEMGKSGELHFRVEHLMLNERRVSLYASVGTHAKHSDGAAVVLTAIFGAVGTLKRGKDVIYPSGTGVLAYVDQSFEVPLEHPKEPPQQSQPPARSSDSAPSAHSASPAAVKDVDTAIEQKAGSAETQAQAELKETTKKE